MEFLPEDLSTPKSVIITNSLVAVVLTAIGLRFWFKRKYLALASSPAAPTATGKFTLQARDFGDEAETRRDASRAFAAGCIEVQHSGEAMAPLKPPEDVPAGVDKEAVAKLIASFGSTLRSRLTQMALNDACIDRILPMLTVNPALGALGAAGELPMLKQNRFLIRATAGVSLHVLTIGYVGAPPNQPNRAQQVLTVASPNLLEAATEDVRRYELSYAIRKAEKTDLTQELSVPGVADVPGMTS